MTRETGRETRERERRERRERERRERERDERERRERDEREREKERERDEGPKNMHSYRIEVCILVVKSVSTSQAAMYLPGRI